MYYIKSLACYNFEKYVSISIDLNEKVNYLIGRNGSGKSTLGIDLVWFIMQGIAEKSSNGNIPFIGERYRFIGPDKATALGEMVIHDNVKGYDIKVSRKMSKTGTELFFNAPAGVELDQQWLNDLFNVFLISPKRFLELSSKEQAIALGINTKEWDDQIAALKLTHTAINKELKAIGDLVEPEFAEEVDFPELSRQKDEINDFNKLQDQRQDAINDAKIAINKKIDRGSEINNEIERLIRERDAILSQVEIDMAEMEKLPRPEDKKPLDEIEEKIQSSTENNRKASAYNTYLEKLQQQKDKEKQIQENKKLLDEQVEKRLEYIKSFKLPFNKLSIDEEGGLLLDNRPLKPAYYSTGELILIVPKLIASTNPELKYIFLQDFNLLDEEMQMKIEKELTDQGFQLMIELVGKEVVKDKNCILLKNNNILERTQA